MDLRIRILRFGTPVVAALAAATLIAAQPALADKGHGKAGDKHETERPAGKTAGVKITGIRLVQPKMDSAKGMLLFASKGCVACHSINGVGGHDATKLDAHTMKTAMNPFDFMAKMWRGAPAMIAAQEEAMEGQIYFTGEEIGHIVAFVHDDKQQHKFTEAMIPPQVKKLMNHSHGAKPKHQGKMGPGKGMMNK